MQLLTALLGISPCAAQHCCFAVYMLKNSWPPVRVGASSPLNPTLSCACSKEIDVSRLESCSACTGSGIKSGTSASTCGTCGGSGQVVQGVRTPLGVFQQVSHPCG